MRPSISSPAPRPLRVLLLEDRGTDAELIVEELRAAGFDPLWRRVDTAAEFDVQLDDPLDLILADYVLPQFDGLAALRRLQQRKLDIPFIMISGALGDERAVECIKAGVTDYLLKDRLERLGLAVTNALEERRLRLESALVEEQLRQAQKMESIGQLAGGIAHDFNNVLTVINGRACLLLDQGGLCPETNKSLNEIYTAGERAANLTRQLLMFSRKRPMQRALLDLNDVVEDIGQMLRRLIGENIVLTLDLAPNSATIEADCGMMEQILLNLAVNARDAMPDGGHLTIATRRRTIAPGKIPAHADAKPGEYVCLQMTDSGVGISAEILPRIFEPFFTTKGVGKGTGLGLATTFGIVRQHDGWIDVHTRVGSGTTFSIFLPVAEVRAPVVNPRWNAQPWPRGGRETILLVEDEQSVRDFAAAVLQSAGYRVLQARSGPEALEVWKWHRSRIELLVTDMVMPDDLSGLQLATQLQKENPLLPVVFTSGYTEENTGKLLGQREGLSFLHKPYQPRMLAQVVRDALDARNPAAATTAAGAR